MMPSVVVTMDMRVIQSTVPLMVSAEDPVDVIVGTVYYNTTDDNFYLLTLDGWKQTMKPQELTHPILILKDALLRNGNVKVTDQNALIIRNNDINIETMTSNVLKDLMCLKFYQHDIEGRKTYVKLNYNITTDKGDALCSL